MRLWIYFRLEKSGQRIQWLQTTPVESARSVLCLHPYLSLYLLEQSINRTVENGIFYNEDSLLNLTKSADGMYFRCNLMDAVISKPLKCFVFIKWQCRSEIVILMDGFHFLLKGKVYRLLFLLLWLFSIYYSGPNNSYS